jgi:hypothetical protein
LAIGFDRSSIFKQWRLKVPNWCSVSFDVRGPAEDLIRFQESVAGNDQGHDRVVDFNKMFPMPEELQAQTMISASRTMFIMATGTVAWTVDGHKSSISQRLNSCKSIPILTFLINVL